MLGISNARKPKIDLYPGPGLISTSPLKMKKSIPFIFTAVLAVSFTASACINVAGTNRKGEFVMPVGYIGKRLEPYLVTPTDKSELVEWSGYVVADARKAPTLYHLIDLSAVLIRFGKLPEAVKLLQFMEQRYPGHYQTASNIGTAYELMGRNEDALKWISEGMKRNPEDHYGTEWLHAQILKAKLRQIQAPAPGRSILNLDFGNEAMPKRPAALPIGNKGKQASIFDVGIALRYQLVERIKFVAAPDPMVAGMLLDWANLELLSGSLESADVLYDAAIRYGSKELPTIKLRKELVARILDEAKTKPSPKGKDGECELCEYPIPPH